MTLPIPTEAVEQAELVAWLELNDLKFSAIPNSTYTPSWNQKRKNHLQGLRPGLPDLLVIVDGHLLFIEMKRIKGGVISPEQKSWIDALNEIDNVEARVCKGFEEAKNFVTEVLLYNRNKDKKAHQS